MTTRTPEQVEGDKARLQHWLGEMYRADVLGSGDRATIMRLAIDTVRADPHMMALVDQRIPELTPIVARRQDRAHVEKKELEYLQQIKEAANG